MTESQPRTALVTGTSSGLGRGVAERLVALGWEVLGTVRGEGTGLPFETVRCDVTDDAAVARLGEQVLERWGRLDALVNNAGWALTGPVEELEPAELRAQLDVNLVAPLAVVRACLPALRAAQGVIVQVSSVAGYSGSDGLWAPYGSSKFGLEGASEALAAELVEQGVRVVVVEPGAFKTEIASKSPQVAAKGSTGLYNELWHELDKWLTWHAATSTDASACVDAIVGAATRPDAPFRLPVGEGIADELRRKGEEMIAQAKAAEQFLASL
jgi:NAD(P)-dependent dehydrogenase (short-subunit alcohol dehydrogenase family)